MRTENGTWVPEGSGKIMLHSAAELVDFVLEQGFVPYFKGRASGWSVEELCDPKAWWNEAAPQLDPWEWRQEAARSEKIAYGKFFENKAGFISREWLPYFISFRRDGYDFDSAWDDGIPTRREKMIVDVLGDREMYSCDLKKLAGFGKNGEKGYDGSILKLQMSGYLLIADFRRKISHRGDEYGWPHTVFCSPETKFGREHVRSQYRLGTKGAYEALLTHAQSLAPNASVPELEKMLRGA